MTHTHPPIVDSTSFAADCTCGQEHPTPPVTLYAKQDACRILAEDCRARYGSRPVLLLSDPDIDRIAGKILRDELRGKKVVVESYRLDPAPTATANLVAKVQAASQDKALIIGVGSGTVNDLAKFSAAHNGIDCWGLATAPSMNGYTSSIAAIKVKGVKRTLPTSPLKRLYAIPQVIQQAPLKLRQSGFCDVQAKVVSDIDWQCESLLCSHSYCALPSALMVEAERAYAQQPEAIGRGDHDAVMGLFKGLLISGVAMSLAGSSAPASGGEHLVSHFLDMREPISGRKAELHGLQVGVGIILSTACYARLARLKRTDLSACAASCFSATAARIPAIWGALATEVAKQFSGKRAALMQFDTLLPKNWAALHTLFCRVKPPEYFADLFSRTGIPFTLDAFRLSTTEFRLAALNARAIRERITVLDLAAHAGVLEAATEDALRLLS